ncbi:MAG: CBS domain-containing protein [Fervidicoccaceae archaeon]
MTSRKGISVDELMSSNVITALPDDPLEKVVSLMLENEVGSVVIVNEKGILLGIITERDLITKVIAKKLNPTTLKAKDIMSSPVIFVEPGITIEKAVEIMQSKRIGHLPVVKGGRVVGIIAEGDIIYLAPEFLQLLQIKKRRKRYPL